MILAPSVLVVDDHAGTLQGVCAFVETSAGLVLAGEASSGEAAIELVRKLQPDFVLMDVRMPGMGGIAATKAIKSIRSSTVVVLFSTTHPDDLPGETRTCGANEILWKADLRRGVLEEIWSRHLAAAPVR